MAAANGSSAVQDTLARMDRAWEAFVGLVQRLPAERLEHRLDAGWTRKQMLAHVATWHELTVERLARFAESGEPPQLDEDTDAVNARAARGAVGRTTGEVVLALQESYRHVRREVARLDDAKLTGHDGWAAATIDGNTYGHYDEHLDDLAVTGRRS